MARSVEHAVMEGGTSEGEEQPGGSVPPNHLSLRPGLSTRRLALNTHPDGDSKPWPHSACERWRHSGQRTLLASF